MFDWPATGYYGRREGTDTHRKRKGNGKEEKTVSQASTTRESASELFPISFGVAEKRTNMMTRAAESRVEGRGAPERETPGEVVEQSGEIQDANEVLEEDTGLRSEPGQAERNGISESGIKLRLKEIELEERRLEAEERRRELEAEERRRELEAEERRRELEAEERRRELEERRLQRESEIRREIELGKLEIENRRVDMDRERLFVGDAQGHNMGRGVSPDGVVDSLEDQKIKKWSDLLKAIGPCVPDNAADFPIFFQGVENIFENQGVPIEFRGKLLTPVLGNKMRNLVSRLSAAELDNYDVIKSAVLEEYKLSATEYRKQFDYAKKMQSETWGQFGARLQTLFRFYMKSRNVNNLEDLEQLVVSDKFRELLPNETKNYVILQEGTGWYRPNKLAELADIHANLSVVQTNVGFEGSNWDRKTYADQKRCFIYGSHFHLASRCPGKHRPRNTYQSHRQGFNRKSDTAKVNLGTVNDNQGEASDRAVIAKVNVPFETDVNVSKATKINELKETGIKELREVLIGCGGRRIPAILDSGTQITVISSDCISDAQRENRGLIKLQGAFGQVVEAELIKLLVSGTTVTGELLEPVEIIAAITDKLAHPCLLPPDVYRSLIKQDAHPFLSLGTDRLATAEGGDFEWEEDVPAGGGSEQSADCMGVETETPSEGDGGGLNAEASARETLITEQTECDTLKEAWKGAKAGKHGYFTIDNLLYHKDKLIGETVRQLVLPRDRRERVLKLAHESVFGGHLGVRKVSGRIRYNFYWPTMKGDIRKYVDTCKNCQLRARVTVNDCVPITPVSRPDLPFQRVNVDIIGPIEPASGRGHRYVLCLVCQHSRWPEAVPLRSLTAKATCDALLEIFCRTGIPEVIATDRGTNFVAGLTNEFIKRLGASPRLSTPSHPASNGLVERWNGVLKRMMHHTIREDPKNWDKQVPYLLWAYREVSNSTTGVPPFKLLYGREPTGPLSILQRSWAGEVPLPCNIGDSAVKYLQDLKVRLELAAEQASLTAHGKQQQYAEYFRKGTTGYG